MVLFHCICSWISLRKKIKCKFMIALQFPNNLVVTFLSVIFSFNQFGSQVFITASVLVIFTLGSCFFFFLSFQQPWICQVYYYYNFNLVLIGFQPKPFLDFINPYTIIFSLLYYVLQQNVTFKRLYWQHEANIYLECVELNKILNCIFVILG